MRFLYIARNSETGEIVTFIDYDELIGFSKSKLYSYDYYSVPIAEELMDVDLFLGVGDDPSDYL